MYFKLFHIVNEYRKKKNYTKLKIKYKKQVPTHNTYY